MTRFVQILALFALFCPWPVFASEPRGPGGGAGEQIGLTGGANRHSDDPFEGRSRDEIKDDPKPADDPARKFFDKTRGNFVKKIRDARDRIKKFQRELDKAKRTGKGRNVKLIEKDIKQAEDDLKKQQDKLNLTSDEMKTSVARGILEADAQQYRDTAKQQREAAKRRQADSDQSRKEASDLRDKASKLPEGSKERQDLEDKAKRKSEYAGSMERGAEHAEDIARECDKKAGELEKQAKSAGGNSSSGADHDLQIREDILPDLSREPIIDPAEFGLPAE